MTMGSSILNSDNSPWAHPEAMEIITLGSSVSNMTIFKMCYELIHRQWTLVPSAHLSSKVTILHGPIYRQRKLLPSAHPCSMVTILNGPIHREWKLLPAAHP